ncbi:MAG TPA: CDP-alcohol phosphatidyltransferase family protein [Syntrophales bacterium]|nr:CDP-alcohol phosphatidyltransferase family protein [Syntrophales bacterium]
MNLPNLLTILRILLVPLVVILLMDGAYPMALAVFVLAGVTDGLDGFLARVLHQKTLLGAYLDPLADKALIASSFITLSILGFLPGWLTVIVITRDLVILFGILLLTLLSVSFQIRPVAVSKVTTALQLFTVFYVLTAINLAGSLPPWIMKGLFGLTALFTVLSGFSYIWKGFRMYSPP